MSVLVDRNILVYAANQECPEYEVASRTLEDLRDGKESWFLTWGIIYEFLRVATHPSIMKYPVPADSALVFVSRLIHSPQLQILKETDLHLALLRESLRDVPGPRGNIFHDIHIVSLMREHGISTILTADKGFRRFKDIEAKDPVHGV